MIELLFLIRYAIQTQVNSLVRFCLHVNITYQDYYQWKKDQEEEDYVREYICCLEKGKESVTVDILNWAFQRSVASDEYEGFGYEDSCHDKVEDQDCYEGLHELAVQFGTEIARLLESLDD